MVQSFSRDQNLLYVKDVDPSPLLLLLFPDVAFYSAPLIPFAITKKGHLVKFKKCNIISCAKYLCYINMCGNYCAVRETARSEVGNKDTGDT